MRYRMAENTYLVASFSPGKSVTITIYKLSDSSVVVNAAAMTEIGSTGMFKYLAALAPSVATEYLWIATDGYDQRAGKIVLGGYPDTLATSQAAEEADIAAIQADVATIAASQAGEEADIATIQGDVSAIEADIATIKASQVAEEAAILLIPTSGDGSIEKIYGPLTDDVTGLPIADAEITIFSDAAMTHRIAFARTDQYGNAGPFQLDPGTVYVRRSKTGYVFSNPDIEVVE